MRKHFLRRLLLLLTVLIVGVNGWMMLSTRDRIAVPASAELADADCILVLGAGVNGSSPSLMLTHRLNAAIQVFQQGTAPVLLMSGDHQTDDYNEVGVMKRYAVENGVPSEKIFLDHAGLSTYDSLYRAKYVYGAGRILIVSQRYHLYRALYLAQSMGMEAVGVEAVDVNDSGAPMRQARECVARMKDWIWGKILPTVTDNAERIPLTGNGDNT